MRFRKFSMLCFFMIGASHSFADVLVTDFATGAILRYSDTGTPLGTFASSGASNGTSDVMAANGVVYVANQVGHVARYDLNGNSLGNLITGASGPTGMRYGPDGNIWIGMQAGGTVRRVTPGGTDLGDFATGLSLPAYAQFFAGQVYVSTSVDVSTFSMGGTPLGSIVAGTSRPTGMEIVGGNLYVANQNSNSVSIYNTSYLLLSSFSVGQAPADIILMPDGTLLIAEYFDHVVTRYSSTGTNLGTFASTESPLGLAYFVVPEPSLFAPFGALMMFGLRRRT
jgi:hypothetical protein